MPIAPPGYRNIFTLDRVGKMPVVLLDGTSVEFPSDWTKKDAEVWRQAAGLVKPSNYRKGSRISAAVLTRDNRPQ